MDEYTRMSTEAKLPISNGVRLLIVTQGVDRSDPTFSFFHTWIEQFAARCEKVHIICLKEGKHNLPNNVVVHSLGKETLPVGRRTWRSRVKYVARLFRYIQGLHHEYDAVFVHQNQEYVLLAGFLWRAMGKRVYLWRNHYAGNALTDIAALFCTRIFCTSRYSYTARYKKTVVMPVGVDTDTFRILPSFVRKQRSILSLGRIASSKRLDVLVGALVLLKQNGISFSADIYGNSAPEDVAYELSLTQKVKKAGCSEAIAFHPGVSNAETVALYHSHEYFVNIAGSGMLDKTIFEAMACGALPVTSNKNLRGEIDPLLMTAANAETLVEDLQKLFDATEEKKEHMRLENRKLAERHSLSILVEQLIKEMGS